MILIDSSLGSKDLIPLMPPELTKKMKLEAGDVAFFGHGPEGSFTFPVGIEYKTATEALTCLTSGRLVGEQLPKMSRLYKRVYLLVEGEYGERSDGVVQFRSWKGNKPTWSAYNKVTYRQFDNWLNSLVESARIVVKRSMDRAESAAQILNLYHLWTKPYENHQSVLKFDKSQQPTLLTQPSLKRLIAAQLPGVGWELSARAADYFPTPYDMVSGTVEQWMQINGVGKTKAQKIYQALRL